MACGAFSAAGMWQLDRAEQKRRLFSEFDASGVTNALTEPVRDDEFEMQRYRPMRLRGRYDSARQFLLDNIVVEGKVGYQVLTPLLLADTSVLVNRGWVPADPDRSVLPDVSVEPGEREVAGLVAPLPVPGLRLEPADVDPSAPWPRRLSFPSAAQIRDQLEYDVAGYQLLLDPDADNGFARDWRPVVMSPEKHLSYAVQWFGLAVALLVIYIVVNLKKSPGGSQQ